MRFIKPSIEMLVQEPGHDGMLRHIERAGRVSYKSEDKITGESCGKFVEMLIERGHLSPLEHGTVYLTLPFEKMDSTNKHPFPLDNAYSTVNCVDSKPANFVTTNYRVIVENGLDDSVKEFVVDRTDDHVARVTFHIVCSRGISHELVRHRAFSFTQESTRYCNYANGKHGSEITCIIPAGVDDIADGERFTLDDIETTNVLKILMEKKHSNRTMMLAASHVACEHVYRSVLDDGGTPQEARDVLPNALKTEVMMTGTIPQWLGFLKLRCPSHGAKGVHPDMAVIAEMISSKLIEKGYV